MRKPGIILLCGEPDPCAAVRTALEALGPGMRCEIWTVPDASQKLREAVREHDGEVWECYGPEMDDFGNQKADPDQVECNIDQFAFVDGEDCTRRPLSHSGDTWAEVVNDVLAVPV